jgi:beta-lactamase regulating signal transducer with metallopeptidase domain
MLKPFIKNRLPKSAQYYLWLVVVAALLVPVSRFVALPANNAAIPSIADTIDRVIVTNEEIYETVKQYQVVGEDGYIGIPAENQSIVDELVSDPWYVELWDWCAIIWWVGAIIMAAYYLCAYIIFVEKVKRTNVPTDVSCAVSVYHNAKANTPMLIGFFSPSIVLPDADYTPEQLRAVLLHELTHLRRKDIHVKWLSVLACAVHWFNPIVWLTRREIDRACELSCDEAVIANLDPHRRQIYGDTLIYVAADSKTPRAVLSTTMCEEKKDLKERLSAIIKAKPHTRAAVIASAAVICAAVLAACALGAGSGNDGYGFTLHETPQKYVLSGEGDSFTRMPSVELFKNGNARLSQPLISSLGMFGLGEYKLSGNEITVTQNESSVAFTISNDGDTLTIKSSNLPFTDVGAVYKYQAKADYLSGYANVDGKALTTEALREIAKKSNDLTVSDFEEYAHVDIDSDYRIFDVEGEYTLSVILDADGNTSCNLERKLDGAYFPLHLNGSTGYVFEVYLGNEEMLKYKPREWYQTADIAYDTEHELKLPEFPNEKFIGSADSVMAGTAELFSGMPIWNVYLADLTNDGKPEFCATVSFGSGIVDTHILVYDYAAGKMYTLWNRGYYDYRLSLEDGNRLLAIQYKYGDDKPLVMSELRIMNGELYRFGETPEMKEAMTPPTETPAPAYDPSFVFENRFEVQTQPGRYTPAMSSYPGIYIAINGQAVGGAIMRYECEMGNFATLEDSIITTLGNFVEREFGAAPTLHWSPISDSEVRGNKITLSLIVGGDVRQKTVLEIKDVDGWYSIQLAENSF